jgi:hypothetical protein
VGSNAEQVLAGDQIEIRLPVSQSIFVVVDFPS